MADCVDPAVQPVQPAVRQPVLDRAWCEPQSGELAMGDDAVLRPGERRDRLVESPCSTFRTIIG